LSEETLVLLTGGRNSVEVWFQIIVEFEKTFLRVSSLQSFLAGVAPLFSFLGRACAVTAIFKLSLPSPLGEHGCFAR